MTLRNGQDNTQVRLQWDKDNTYRALLTADLYNSGSKFASLPGELTKLQTSDLLDHPDNIIHYHHGSGGRDMLNWWIRKISDPKNNGGKGLVARINCKDWSSLDFIPELSPVESGRAENTPELLDKIEQLGACSNKEEIGTALLELNSYVDNLDKIEWLALSFEQFSEMRPAYGSYYNDFGDVLRTLRLRNSGGESTENRIDRLKLLFHVDEIGFIKWILLNDGILSAYLDICAAYQPAPFSIDDIETYAQINAINVRDAESLVHSCGGDRSLCVELLRRLAKSNDQQLDAAIASVKQTPPNSIRAQKICLSDFLREQDPSLAERFRSFVQYESPELLPGDEPPSIDTELCYLGWLGYHQSNQASGRWGIRSPLHAHFARQVLYTLSSQGIF